MRGRIYIALTFDAIARPKNTADKKWDTPRRRAWGYLVCHSRGGGNQTKYSIQKNVIIDWIPFFKGMTIHFVAELRRIKPLGLN